MKMRSGKTRDYVPAKPKARKDNSKKVEEEQKEEEKEEVEEEETVEDTTPSQSSDNDQEEENQSDPEEEDEDEEEDGGESSDEAPEEFGFQEAKATATKELKDRKEQVKEEEEKKKERKKQRLEQWKQEKDDKLKRQEANNQSKRLPDHLLAQIGQNPEDDAQPPPAAKKRKKENRVTRFDPEDHGSRVSVVSRKDETRHLSHTVSQSVLDFKERMLFGGHRARQREPTKVAAMRREKAKLIGANVMAK